MTQSIPFHKAHITEDEINEVVDTLRSGWLTMGPKTIAFENAFGECVGSKQSVSLNSATAALHLALKAIGLKEGDEVILPTNTFVSTAEVVTYFNAIPVLCDIEYETHNMDVSKIEALITKNTKAIIPVHFAGNPCDMDPILEIAAKYKLHVIEDAAHAVPAKYKGRAVGSIGDMTCFSFYATKTLATGEGGMLTTNNEEWAKSVRINRLHGISKDAWDRYTAKGAWHYEVVENGHKYNMTDIAASLGLVQLKKIDWMREERAKIVAKYDELLQSLNPISVPEGHESAHHLYVIKINNRDAAIERLKEAGVGSSVHFIPIHHHPYYKKRYGYKASDYPVAEAVFNQSLSLPLYPGLSTESIDRIIKQVQNIADPVR
ncbi:DegT/DnrJ/EryC1/StrS family aminotransferase [bacterium]|jgi:dTDP-4-amino-4,6-dideoxygalactose transaminase|nr:DegT/DnrJ/EryC1/StrS family aminotransferase [bacterium]